MANPSDKSYSHALSIFLLYLLPILFWIYALHNGPQAFSWPMTILGLLLLFFGSALLFSLTSTMEEPEMVSIPEVEAPPEPTPVSLPDETPKYLLEIEQLRKHLQEKNALIDKAESEKATLKEENLLMKEKLESLHSNCAEKEEEVRRKIEEMQRETHQKQQAIQQLENQIHDLRYEIKTLLQLTEVDYSALTETEEEKIEPLPIEEPIEPPPAGQVTSEGEALRLLKRCLDIAQKMTPGYQASSLRSLSADPYAFDLRRLADSLRLETGALILVYSPKDERLLFTNAQSKALLGWSSEKFTQDFPALISESLPQWKSAVSQLLTKSEVHLPLVCKAKNEEFITLQALIGGIPTGVFRTLVIGVLYPHPA